jgi:hypothetical protein
VGAVTGVLRCTVILVIVSDALCGWRCCNRREQHCSSDAGLIVNWQYVNSMSNTDEEQHLIDQYGSGTVPQAQVDTFCEFDSITRQTTSTLRNMLCRLGACSATARLISSCNDRRTRNTGGASTMAVSGRHSSSSMAAAQPVQLGNSC